MQITIQIACVAVVLYAVWRWGRHALLSVSDRWDYRNSRRNVEYIIDDLRRQSAAGTIQTPLRVITGVNRIAVLDAKDELVLELMYAGAVADREELELVRKLAHRIVYFVNSA